MWEGLWGGEGGIEWGGEGGTEPAKHHLMKKWRRALTWVRLGVGLGRPLR